MNVWTIMEVVIKNVSTVPVRTNVHVMEASS